MKRISLKANSGSKGQSFVELSLVVLLLMELVAGIAEFGVLLNRYLNIVDGAREAARYAANYDPFGECPTDPPGCHVDGDGISNFYYLNTTNVATDVIQPIQLNPTAKDDMIVSIFIVTDTDFCRYPEGSENGWSYMENYAGYLVRNHNSAQSSAYVEARMKSGWSDPGTPAPPVSMILVEIFYNYPQTLKAPFYEQFFPDPVPVYTFSIMPLKNATPLVGHPCYVPPT